MQLPTVKVCSDNEYGYIVINESDLNDSHKIYDPESDVKAAQEQLDADEKAKSGKAPKAE